jgi:hypothetical protein
MGVPDEVFNPPGADGAPLQSIEDAIEAAACVALARWLADHRPDVVAVEFDGTSVGVSSIRALTVQTEPSMTNVAEVDEPDLWARVTESWELLLSIGRATHRVVAADEARNWQRGD